MTAYQGRGTNRASMTNVVNFLKANPGATAGQVMAGTKLSAPTVRPMLERVADSDDHWPRGWTIKPAYENFDAARDTVDIVLYKQVPALKAPKVGEYGELGLRKVWPAWIKVHKAWPQALTKLVNSHDPAEIARGLDALAKAAATLAQGFRQVQREPDWYERLGGK